MRYTAFARRFAPGPGLGPTGSPVPHARVGPRRPCTVPMAPDDALPAIPAISGDAVAGRTPGCEADRDNNPALTPVCGGRTGTFRQSAGGRAHSPAPSP